MRHRHSWTETQSHDVRPDGVLAASFRAAVAALACLLLLASSPAGFAQNSLIMGSVQCPSGTSCAPGAANDSPPDSGGVCHGPSDGGETSPCEGDGPAGQGNASGTEQGAGNPINVVTGNKYQKETDLSALPGVLGLEIVRHYNSQYARNVAPGVLGRGWALSYETQLYARPDVIHIVQADGTRVSFSRDPKNPSVCSTRDPSRGQVLVRRAKRGEEYVWTWTCGANAGRRLTFDSRGRLMKIESAAGEAVTLQYGPQGFLSSVTDPQGRSLRLNYGEGSRYQGVSSIDSPVGRYRYTYGDAGGGASLDTGRGLSAYGGGPSPTARERADAARRIGNLVRADSPDGSGRVYHYEEKSHPNLLTGVSQHGADGEAQRLSSYGYDAQGYAVSSAPQGEERIRIESRSAPRAALPGQSARSGETVLEDGEGRKTRYAHAVIGGENRLLEARGPGCARCGPGNMRYRYNEQGQLEEIIRLDGSGRALATVRKTFDVWGRVTRVERAVGDGAFRLLSRYEYPAPHRGEGGQELAFDRPTLIARPSVAPGREHRTEISWNARGQAVRVAESGWRPDFGASGEVSWVPVSRAADYRYAEIGGRSALVEIDGPLPNGPNGAPEDSDITRVEWDAQGRYVTRVTRPGGGTLRLERDDAGRVARTQSDENGHRRQLDYRYGARGQAERWAQQDMWLDAQGQADGASRLERSVSARHDSSGRLSRLETPSRTLDEAQLDALRARLRAGLEMPSMDAAALLADGGGARQALWRDARGEALLWGRLGEEGSAARDEAVALQTRDGRRVERWFDDFGNLAALRNPGQGIQSALYDGAGRLIEARDPRGAAQRRRYDAAGRLVGIEWRGPSSAEAESSVSLRHCGPWVCEASVSDGEGARRTLFRRDAQGRILSETQRVEWSATHKAAGARDLAFTLEHQHDAQGRRTATALVDGQGRRHTVEARRDDDGEIQELTAQGRLPAWLGGDALLARVEERREVGGRRMATRLAHGNGEVEDWGAEAERLLGEMAQAEIAQAVPWSPRAEAEPDASDAAPARTGGRLPGAWADAAGLPYAYEGETGRWHLDWDAAGRLAGARRLPGAEAQAEVQESRYLYDASGRRVAKRLDNGRLSYYIYDGLRLVAEADASGRAEYRHVWLGHRAVAQIDLRPREGLWARLLDWLGRPESRALHTTASGEALRLTDASGATLWQAGEGGAAHQPLRHAGQYHDVETGLIYHGARYVDPLAGRFLSPDPAGAGESLAGVPPGGLLDLYLFAGGRPDLYFDPDGAARITYYLIDDAPGTSGAQQNGRWAFWLENGSQNYLYDAGGDFLQTLTPTLKPEENLNALKDTYAAWSPATVTSPPNAPAGYSPVITPFLERYALNAISPPGFTKEISDAAAQAIIDDLGQNDALKHKYFCAGGGGEYRLVFPSVSLGTGPDAVTLWPGGVEDAPGAAPGGAAVSQGSDTFRCKTAMTPNQAFRVTKRAVEQQESGGANCAPHGCPAQTANPLGNTAACWQPSLSSQQICPNEPASYGPSQFTVATLLEEMKKLSKGEKIEGFSPVKPLDVALRVGQKLTPDERLRLGFSSNSNTGLDVVLNAGQNRSYLMARYWDCFERSEGTVCTLNNNISIVRATFEELADLDNYLDLNAKLGQDPDATPAENINNNQTKRAEIQERLKKFARDTGLGLVNVTITQQGNQQNIQREYNEVTALNYYTRLLRWAEVKKLLNPHVNAANQTLDDLPLTVAERKKVDSHLLKLGMTAANIRRYLQSRRWNEGVNAFQAAAIFSQPRKNGQPAAINLRAAFVTNADSYYKNKAKFDTISDRVIMREINKFRREHPEDSERQIAAKLAYYHNEGKHYDEAGYPPLTGYVNQFLGRWDAAVNAQCGQTTVPRFTLDPARGPQPTQAQ